MSSGRHARAKELFLAAYELPPDERLVLLDQACGDDVELRREVESLLRFRDETDSPPEIGRAGDVSPSEPGEKFPRTIGPYRMLQKVGEGGMGEVWEAEQDEPVRRRVALKLIKAGMDTKQVVARFESERQALALMSHPVVAKVFDAGMSPQGRPYFAMEFVRGEPITVYCDRHRLTNHERLHLFMQLCEGVQHAHQKGIIHRDLKPSNVLVELQDGKPVPKIIDFGVAKATQQRLTEKTLFTQLGVLVGTPAYMSPEQAEMTGLDVDTRTDVYSLGVMLYELLVGVPPFDPKALHAAGYDEIRRKIREEEPSRPSARITTPGEESTEAARRRSVDLPTLRRELRGDLDWITMKALAKDRTRRYGSPNELAADLARHLEHQPVEAGPPSPAYRMRKFVRRHRVGVVASGLATAGIVLGLVLATFGMVTAQRERDRATAEATTARRINVFLQEMLSSADPYRGTGTDTTILEAMDWAHARVETGFADEPGVRADVETTLGEVYRRLGRFDRAEPLLRSGLAGRRALYGDDDVRVAGAMFCLASLIHDRGDAAAAEPLYRKTLDIYRRTLGPRHPEFAVALNTLARMHRDRGDYEAAERLFREVLDLRRSILGGDDADLAVTQFDLAQLIQTRNGDLTEAENLIRESLAINRRVFGEDHPDVASALSGLAGLALGRGEIEEAEDLFRQALAIDRRTVGSEHDEVASTLLWLGHTLQRKGDLESAVPMVEEALGIYRRLFGERHPYVATALQNLAVLYREIGRHEEAIPLYRQSLEIHLATRGAEHHITFKIRGSYGLCLARAGRFEEAEEQMLIAFPRLRETMGADHPDTLWVAKCLVELYETWGRPDEAEEYRTFLPTGSSE